MGRDAVQPTRHEGRRNNYIAIKQDGEVKAKGLYAPTGRLKNPTMEVCSRAVAEYLKKGTKPETNPIKRQKDITQFMTIRGVSAGGFSIPSSRWSMTG